MLQCLMVAIRPLRVEEVAELLAFEFKAEGVVPKYRMDWRPNDQVEAVLSTCSSLISIVDDNEFQVVQFSHFSVKEFLMSNRLGDYSQYQILPRPAHTILAQACLGCLLHLDDHVDDGIVKGLPLAEYASKHWVTHAQFEDVASRVKDGMEILFDCNKPHFRTWVGLYNMDEQYSSKLLFKIPTPLYYSSLCGFSDLVKHLSSKHPQQVNTIGGKYKFPLLAALIRTHIRVAEILLEHGANVNIRGLRERTPLHEAIPNVGMVQSLLKKGADVNSRQDDLRTPLHLAACCGALKVALVLAEHNADVNSQDSSGKTPLDLLREDTRRDSDNILDFARLLLEHGVDVNAQREGSWTSLHRASFKGRVEVARVLLDHGANARLETKKGETALHIVSRGKYKYSSEEQGASTARLLLERGADVNAQKKDGWTSLHEAAFKGRVEVARVLLDHGANARLETTWGETALHFVSGGKYISEEQGASTARLLLERGADVNAQEKDGWTSLHDAAFKGRVEVARVLLDHGANARLGTKWGETALHFVSQGQFDSPEQGTSTARLLLERGVDVDAQEKTGRTSLHEAAFRGRVEVVRVLLDHGANAMLETKMGEMAVHMVSRGIYNSQEQGASTARLLLEHGVDVNVQEEDGWTSLHWAAFKGRVKVARVLLSHGANAKLKTTKGETALHTVSRGKYNSQEQGVSIARLLLKRGVDVNAQEKDGLTSLHFAAYKGRDKVVRVLLDHGANVKLETKGGKRTLHMVSQGKFGSQKQGTSTARLLLEHGVDVHFQDKYFGTALHSAAFNGRPEVTRLLLSSGVNPNAENEQGRTPLHQVSRGEYKSQEHGVEIVRLLLEHGADVDARGKNKSTPLHDAAFHGKLEVVQVCLFL